MRNIQMKSVTKALAVVLIGAFAVGNPGIVNAQDEELTDIGSITCRDVLLSSGEVRDGVILVLHAYLLGEAKQLTYDDNVLGEATDRFLDACIAKPDTQALATLREQMKSVD